MQNVVSHDAAQMVLVHYFDDTLCVLVHYVDDTRVCAMILVCEVRFHFFPLRFISTLCIVDTLFLCYHFSYFQFNSVLVPHPVAIQEEHGEEAVYPTLRGNTVPRRRHLSKNLVRMQAFLWYS